MRILSIILILFISACSAPEVKVEMVSERTTLENQILGTYNSIDKQMLLVASVRGVDSEGNMTKKPSHTGDHKDAIKAMQLLDFHSDDLHIFKILGWAGENLDGKIEKFEIIKDEVPEEHKSFVEKYTIDEFNEVIDQVNSSREIIIMQMSSLNENISKKDMVKVRKIFGKLNIRNAEKGEKIQTEDGSWSTK